MKRTFLYYPSISIPETEWINSVLLYSDEISSIVPSHAYEFGDNFPDYIKKLMDNGEYRPVYARYLLDTSRKEFQKFEERFFKIVDSREFQDLSGKENKTSVKNFFHIYEEKIPYNIRTFLDEKHLIEPKWREGKMLVEENTAILYMSLLAQFVSEVDENLVIPCTDDKRVEKIAFKLTDNKQNSLSLLLEKCLPNPRAGTDVMDIISYKRKHHDELLRFRQFLSKIQERINKSESANEVKEILIDTKEKIELELKDIAKTLSSESIKTVFTSLNSLLKVDTPKLFSSLTAAGLLTTAINPIVGVAVGTIGVAGTLISSHVETKSKISKNELSYLFHTKDVLE